VQILHQVLVERAAFPRPAIVVGHVRGGAQDPKAHFARGVAAQHRAVLPGAPGDSEQSSVLNLAAARRRIDEGVEG